MPYQPLPFEQYFIDNSERTFGSRAPRRKVEYKAVHYQCSGLERLLHLHHEVNYEIAYEPDRDVIQINFQKSKGFGDWYANIAEFTCRYYHSIDFDGQKLQLRVHHGWGAMYKSVKHELRSAWYALHRQHPDAVTEIIGWSLGGGQAILCAQDLNYNFGIKPYLYTFGTVRPFRYTRSNRQLMERYLEGLCTECYNFSNINDIVTYMPPFYGYTMPRRVELGGDRRSLGRLLNPYRFHFSYHQASLYSPVQRQVPKEAVHNSK